MLEAVLTDFRAWGAVRTVTTHDRRLTRRPRGADVVVDVTPGEYEAVLTDLLETCEAALVIAPETNGVLTRLSALVETVGLFIVGSRPMAVAVATDKWACHEHFRAAGLPTPETRLVRRADLLVEAIRFGFPLVVKPVDGAGCEGVCRVRSPEELTVAQELLAQTTRCEKILLQRLVPGDHASVSLLVTDDGRVRPLSLNGQRVVPGCPFTYRGGVVPLQHPLRVRAFEVAEAAVRQVPGLRGYVGVDLVLADGEAWLMEINPRLTTSYIGLRRVVPYNLARAIWAACREGRLPEDLRFTGRAVLTKVRQGIRCQVFREDGTV
ncbi:D-alanine--D-alanine ligase [bacterium HR11]|nr:D-alanine--D-alanine ligase [bacterium HR11]